jgi:DNA-binding response OmpR family regulator
MLAPPDGQATALRGPNFGPVARDLIFVVEDDDVIAGLLERILARGGHRVVRAVDAAQCELLFQRHERQIALVILDCRLPDAHGGLLCNRLRNQSPGLPVLLTSGREQVGLCELFAADGPTAFLPKPFFPRDVERLVESLIRATA